MATNPRSTMSERPNLALVSTGRKAKPNPSKLLTRRLISTAVALAVLALVLRYLPPGARNARVQAAPAAIQTAPTDLHLSDLQISETAAGEALYLDGLVTNQGKSRVTGATAEVDFHDEQGKPVATLQLPIVGIARGGGDIVRNEFTRNPILPSEMRFFRVEVPDIPPTWNHEVPALKIVAVKAQ